MPLVALALVSVLSTTAGAFHEGGTAQCDGCHTMHNTSGRVVNNYLLMSSDQSSMCLSCHASAGFLPDTYRIATYPTPGPTFPPRQLTPGGDFAYVRKNYHWVTSGGAAAGSIGDSHGHNVVALDFQFSKDTVHNYAPGGSYPSDYLSCTSCHDPHGKYRIMADGITQSTSSLPIGESGSFGALPTAAKAVGVYRMLGGAGYLPESIKRVSPALAFGNNTPAPVAVAPQDYNRPETLTDTRVSYGMGMSEWCGNCHGSYLYSKHSATLSHASGNNIKLQDVAAEYNSYIKSYIYTGTFDTAYTSLVPFEQGTNNLSALAADTSSTTGASPGSNVMCLTCHRAHASAWNSATRWNSAAGSYLTIDGSYPGINAPTLNGQKGEYATGKTVQEYQQAMYGRDISKFAPDITKPGTDQGSLCNKCHWNEPDKKVSPE